MGVFSIPGNIKQAMLPFSLDPNNQINTVQNVEAKDVKGNPQKFSFRQTSTYEKFGRLNICPTSLQSAFEDDISFQTVFIYESEKKKTENITLDALFKHLPGIQIREYLPDTRLDQALDFFGKLREELMKVGSKSKTDSTTTTTSQSKTSQSNDQSLSDKLLALAGKLSRVCKFAIRYITGFNDPNFFTDMFSNGGSLDLGYPTDLYKSDGVHNKVHTYLLQFPFTMWYALQSATTTNIYELPFIQSEQAMYTSNGNPGWGSAGFSMTDMIKKIPMIGETISKLVRPLISNVNISMLPWWDATNGNNTPHQEVKVQFDLFNDTADATLNNFIFINTIVPNARWVQYSLFQHSPSLYDVKIEGVDRLYACAAQFTVTARGVMRKMPDTWFDDKLKGHINECMNKTKFLDALKQDDLVKIPDIYHVEMTFTSLLPDNFNQFIFNYSRNANMMITDTGLRKDSSAPKIIANGFDSLAKNIKDVWNGQLAVNDNGDTASK